MSRGEGELTLRELNRALLARQLLLRRIRLSVPRAVGRLCALQAQYSPSPYIALWSRLEGFRRSALTRALESGAIVHAALLRSTLHVISRADLPAFAAAYVDTQRGRAERRGVDLDALAAALPSEPVAGKALQRLASQALGTDDDWTVAFALRCFPFVTLPPGGTWRHHGGRTVTLWAEPLPPAAESALRLVRRCLSAFGPMSREDVEHFTYLRRRNIDAALQGMRTFRAEDGRLLFDVPRGPLPRADAEAPVRFLPTFDSVILAHHDRSRIIPPDYVETVIRRVNATTLATFTVDGFIAGSWRVERKRDSAVIVLAPFAPLPRRALTDVEAEAGRLVRWLEDGATSFTVRLSL